jgi:hypothetical protein
VRVLTVAVRRQAERRAEQQEHTKEREALQVGATVAPPN